VNDATFPAITEIYVCNAFPRVSLFTGSRYSWQARICAALGILAVPGFYAIGMAFHSKKRDKEGEKGIAIMRGKMPTQHELDKILETVKMRKAINRMTRGYVKRKPDPHKGVKHHHYYLYFIQCGDMVKIGKAIDAKQRMKELQTGNPAPLRLLAAFARKGHLESEYHRRFKHLHIRGEWFQYTEEIRQCIKGMVRNE